MPSWSMGEGRMDLTVRDRRMMKGLDRVQERLVRFRARMEGVATAARRMLLVGAASVGFLVKISADAEEMASKFKAVFKEEAKGAEDFARRLGKATNRSHLDIMEFMSSLQDTFVPLGFARKHAARLSGQLAQLAVDMASFYNVAERPTIDALTSALVGNHEAVRRFGVVITQATLGQELLRMGFKGGTKAATEQQKVTARLRLIIKSTSDAHGDAERTAKSFTNTWRGMTGHLKLASKTLGDFFKMALTPFLIALTDAIKSSQKWLEVNGALIVKIAAVGAALAGVLVIAPRLIGAIRLITVAFRVLAAHPIVLLIAAIAALVGALVWVVTKGATFREKMQTIFRGVAKIVQWFNPIVQAIKDTWQVMWTAVRPIVEAIRTVVVKAFTWMGETIAKVTSWMGERVGRALNWLKDTFINSLLVLQVAIENWRDVLRLVLLKAVKSIVWFALETKHFFCVVIPDFLGWFLRNWKEVFTDLFNFTTTVFKNMWHNVYNFFKSLWSWLKGDEWDFEWKGLTDGFKSALEEYPKYAKRQQSVVEAGLDAHIARIQKKLGAAFAEKYTKFWTKEWMKGIDLEPPGRETPEEALDKVRRQEVPPDQKAGAKKAAREARTAFVGLQEMWKRLSQAGAADKEKKALDAARKTAKSTTETAKQVTKIARWADEGFSAKPAAAVAGP